MSATITGQVTSNRDKPLPGTVITLINAHTHKQLITIANDNGVYQFTEIFPDTYDMKAELPGFEIAVKNNLHVKSGETLTVSFQLQIAKAQGPLV